MRHALKGTKHQTSSSARVVDGKLILSLPGALTPVVWQMDFGDVKASALEVREDKTEKSFKLVLKTPTGNTTEIAPFETRQQAVDGLMAASKALENAHGKIRGTAEAVGSDASHTISYVTTDKKRSSKWGILLGILFLVILFGIWGSLSMKPPTSSEMAATSTGTGVPASSFSGNTGEPGVPMSADQFLRAR